MVTNDKECARSIFSRREGIRQYNRLHAVGEETSRARCRRTFSTSVSVPSHLISSPVPPSDTRHRPPNNSLSRHCVKLAPSSLPRRTYRRPCSPSRARIRYGAVLATRGRPHTQQVAPPVARARYSPWTVPRLALARTSAGAYAFRQVTAVSMGSNQAWGVCHSRDPSVRCFVLLHCQMPSCVVAVLWRRVRRCGVVWGRVARRGPTRCGRTSAGRQAF